MKVYKKVRMTSVKSMSSRHVTAKNPQHQAKKIIDTFESVDEGRFRSANYYTNKVAEKCLVISL